MRNNRGEWQGRDKWDRSLYEFERNSGLRSSDFKDDSPVDWASVGDRAVVVVCLIVAVWLMFSGTI